MTHSVEEALSAEPPIQGSQLSKNWEEIFESSENGFIPLVKQAKTVDGLRECTHLIIRSLFTRDEDLKIREVYETALDGLLPATGVEIPPMDKGVIQIVQLLREIKEYRQTKAQEYAEQMINKEIGIPEVHEPERRETSEPDPLPGLEPSSSEKGEVSDNEEAQIEGFFADIFCERIKKRFDVLTQRVEKNPKNGSPPPFILSRGFAQHFEELLRQYFIPFYLENSRSLIARTAQQPIEQRRDYLVGQFDGRVSSQNLWDRWKDIWAQLVHPQELPAKPEPKKKAGLLGGLKKKKKKVPAFMKEMTLDEWKIRTKEIKEGNKKAEEIWALIVKESDAYILPQFDDEKLLMDLFARSANGMQNHINALSQIAGQGDDIGRALSAYIQGKDIDLPLLATCFQFPDLFLGKKQGLTKMLMGMDEDETASKFPLVKRYLL